MFKFCTLFSGSSGNAMFLEYKNTKILIDCGVSCKRICENLKMIGESPESIDAILITHEHIDHIAGVSVFSKKFNTPVYATEDTINFIDKRRPLLSQNIVIPGLVYKLGDVVFKPFEIPHDALSPVGYVFELGNKKLSIATDMGRIDADILNTIKGSDLAIIEANHDTDMLINGPYPYPLKKRVLSGLGHLSNEQAAKIAGALVRTGTKQILLAHLSATNNTQFLALSHITNYLKMQNCIVGTDVLIDIADRFNPGKMIGNNKDRL